MGLFDRLYYGKAGMNLIHDLFSVRENIPLTLLKRLSVTQVRKLLPLRYAVPIPRNRKISSTTYQKG